MQTSPATTSLLPADTHPLRAAVQRAEAMLIEEVQHARSALEYARAALVDSDCPREWTLIQDGYEYELITATCTADALNEARANVSRSDYPDMKGTIFVTFGATCQETEESCEDTLQLDEPEPPCVGHDAHDWQSPVELVGGSTENPGVFGHGGGVLIHEACMHCGCRVVTDTWASNPTTGTDGHTTVTYEPGFYDVTDTA